MRKTYIDIEGNYGDAEGLLIYDSTSWTSEDFNTLDWATRSEKQAVAQLIDTYHEQTKEIGEEHDNHDIHQY